MRGQLVAKFSDIVDHHYRFVDLKEQQVIQENVKLYNLLKKDIVFYFKVSLFSCLLSDANAIVPGSHKVDRPAEAHRYTSLHQPLLV